MIDLEIDEIRKVRHEISEECGHDIHKVVAYYREVEHQLKKSGHFRFEEFRSDRGSVSAKLD